MGCCAMRCPSADIPDSVAGETELPSWFGDERLQQLLAEAQQLVSRACVSFVRFLFPADGLNCSLRIAIVR